MAEKISIELGLKRGGVSRSVDIVPGMVHSSARWGNTLGAPIDR
jgi:hypothetical protein